MTRISVITPSFNQGRYLERCIASVVEQGCADVEHLVIDNCSIDETHAVLRRHPHVAWISEPDRGQSDAVNKGLARARGAIIAWINADDYYLPGAFDVALEHLAQPGRVAAIAGGVELVDADGGRPQRFTPTYADQSQLIEFWSQPYGLCQPGVLFRREVVDTIGGLATDLHYAMDYDFWLRMTARFDVRVVPQVLAGYRLHDASKTTQRRHFTGFFEEMERVSRRYWGPWGSRQRRRRAAACRRRGAELAVDEILDAHRAGRRPPARLYLELLKRRPWWLLCRNLSAMHVERLLGAEARAAVAQAAPRRAETEPGGLR